MNQAVISRALRGLLLLSATLTLGCDQVTKRAATVLLSEQPPVPLLPGMFDLRYVQNHDVAFNVLDGLETRYKPALLAVLAVVILAMLGVMWWRRRQARAREQLGYALIVGGAAGNIVDRVLHGFVVDFMHITGWPVFNVADVAIVLGVALLVLTNLQLPRVASAPRL